MAFKNRLLATAAIPLIALMGIGPVSAAGLPHPSAPAEAQSLVVKVQATDEELLQQQRKERKERRENRQNQQNQNNAGQDDQEQVKPRHKKQNDNADMQMQQDNSGQAQQDDQEQVKPRRKKQNDNADMQMQQDNSGQVQQDDQEQVKPRRKKQNDNADMQMQQDNSGQVQQDDQEQVKPRRKKQNDNADMQMQQDNSGQAQQDDQEQVKPRRKKQNDNAAVDEGQSTDDKLKNAIENTNKKHRKQDQNQAQDQNQGQDQADQPTDNANGSIEKIETRKKKHQQAEEGDNTQQGDQVKIERPVDVKKAKDIAADPSKTTDTVVLPVENGAAVLDSDKDADNRGADRERRKKERQEIKQVRVPKSDKDAQRGFREDDQVRIRPVMEDKGERIPGFKGYDDFGGRRVGDHGDRVVINIGGRIVIRSDDDTRIARDTQIRYERLPNNLIREVVIRPDGDRIITVRNRWGEIVRRSRVDRDNREVVIFYSPVLERGRDRLFLRDPGEKLPPMRLTIPVNDYIIDVSGGGGRDFEQFLEEPPVEQVERVYTVDEVKNSARIRDKMRRIDLDTITFDTGSSDIAEDQVQSLKRVGNAIKDILDKDPGETFLIEGHTDAVGSDESNLVLSDSRAESVANVLSQAFDIPAENLVTQGYGERYLKVNTDEAERANRRVTIRRITPLVRPLDASAQ